MRRPRARTAGGALACALLAACSTAGAQAPDWRPQSSFSGEGGGPQLQLPAPNASPTPPSPSSPSSPAPPPNSGSPSTANSGVVAKHLTAPTAIAVLPDGTALVGERTTGRIVRVQPVPDQPVTVVRTLPGLDTTGDGGLLDLALSPTYDEDNLVYAYVTTPSGNEVVDFTLSGPVTPVVRDIPKGASGNVGRIMFSATGELYVGTGDAGVPANAASATSLAGKVLRINAIGQPADGNPSAQSPIYTRGHRRVDGLCQDGATGRVYEVERGPIHGTDEVNLLTARADYGWPAEAAASVAPVIRIPPDRSGVGDCAIASSQLYVTSLDGTALLTTRITSSGPVSAFTPMLDGTYGRLLTVVAAPDGALWLTTSNKDGHGRPVADDERVVRIVPAGGGGAPPIV